jgi:hypothetical protein
VGSRRTHEWKRRPGFAKLFRGAAWVVPIVASLGAALAVSFLLTQPEGLGLLMWWAVIAAAGTLTLVVLGPLARRAVLLAALLDLSLVFPSQAPSRSFIALRASSHRRVQMRLIGTSGPNSVANARIADRMALASALGVLRQQRHRQTRRARAIRSAFLVAAVLITGTVLFPAPRQAALGRRAAGPAVAAPGPRAGVTPSPSPPQGTVPLTSPTPTTVAGSSNPVAGTTTSDDTRGQSMPPGVTPSSSSFGPTLSAGTGGGSAPPEGAGPSANAVAAAPGGAVVLQTTQPLTIASGQSAQRLATESRLTSQVPSPLRTGGAVTDAMLERTNRTEPAPKGATGKEGRRSEAADSLPAAPPNRAVTSGTTDSNDKAVDVSASPEEVGPR